MALRQVAAALLAVALTAHAAPRSAAARLEFRRHHPCPATGSAHGACPGYVIDHVIPLCAGGADAPSNMAWQEYAESLKKDAEERRLCRALRAKSHT